MSEPQNNQGDLKGVLKEIVLRKIRKLHKSAERTGGNFNVFSILDRERKEVTTHSAIIAELLNPHGSHGQETSFLKLFLGQLLEKLQEDQKAQLEQLREKLEQIQKDELDKFKVEVETPKKNKKGDELGRIDILIESHGLKSGDVCIVIENKIDAEDQERQLGRYYEYALDTGKEPGVIYLTLEGGEPKEKTLYGSEPYKIKMSCCEMSPTATGVCPQTPRQSDCRMLPKDTVVCLSYEKFIGAWLDACIKEIAHIPQIRETLHQYQMTVRKLIEKPTEQLPPEVEDILNGLEEKDGIIKDVQHELLCEFWKELKERFESPKFHNWTQKAEEKEISDSAEEFENYIRNRSLVLTFSIPTSLQIDDNEHEVAFRVHYEESSKNSYFNYGFVLRRKSTLGIVEIIPEDKKARLNPYVMLENRSFKYGWISWDYFQYEPKSFITESRETLIRKLISEINLALALVETRKNNKT